MSLTNYHDQWLDFFEDLAKKHKEILHSDSRKRFLTRDLEFKGNNLEDTILLCSPPISGFTGTADNAIQKYDFELWFLFSCADDNDEIKAAQRKGELIALDFISAIEHYAGSGSRINQRTVATFAITDCRIDLIGPLNQSYYGVSLSVILGSLRNFLLDDTKWTIPFE